MNNCIFSVKTVSAGLFPVPSVQIFCVCFPPVQIVRDIFHLCSSFAYIPSFRLYRSFAHTFPMSKLSSVTVFILLFFTASHDPSVTAAASAESFDHCRPRRPSCSVPALTRRASSRRSPCFKIYVIKPMLRDIVSILHDNSANKNPF